MLDYHVHTSFSDDSTTDMEDMVKQGLKKGLSEICFTDHMEYDSTEPDEFEELDTDNYLKEIRRLQTLYSGSIKINAGVEIGLQPHILQWYEGYISGFNFDYVLASLHAVKGYEVGTPEFHNVRDYQETLKDYFEELYICVKNYSHFDVLGHMDIVRRYTYRHKGINEEIYQGNFISLIDEILLLLIDRGQGIEINTSGYRYGLKSPLPSLEIVKRFKELGGEIVTIGSDGHTTFQLALGLENALKMLKQLGFKYLYTFNKREPYPVKVDDYLSF